MPKELKTAKRVALTAIQKKQIRIRKQENPKITDQDIAKEFGCDRSTVTKILKQGKWEDLNESSYSAKAKSSKQAKYPQVEQALELWVGTLEQRKLTLTGDLLRQKALTFAEYFGISAEEFKASNGWVTRFKARAGLRNVRLQGEAESAPIHLLPQFRQELHEVLAQYEPQDIFNADESGLYYRMDSCTTIANASRKGKKKDKTRITIMCTANASGCEKLKLLVINNSNMPHAFRESGIITHNQLPVIYDYNAKAWMRQNIFQVVLSASFACIFLTHLNRTSFLHLLFLFYFLIIYLFIFFLFRST
jgi:hypothetical protein